MVKVLIIGPCINKKKSGGVALFTENLADGFKRNGIEVKIITDISEKKKTEYGVEILVTNTELSFKNPLSFFKLSKLVKNEEPSYVISSLAYSLIFFLQKKSHKKYIHFVHGFPSVKIYGFFKFFGMLIFDKMIRKKSDYLITNSNFSRIINQDLNNNMIDYVVPIGVGYSFMNNLDLTNEKEENIIFIGRLVKAKNVDKIIRSYQNLESEIRKNHALEIYGYGEEEENIRGLINLDNEGILFKGAVESDKVNRIYRNSKVFISLNGHEPFGMVFLEALLNGCFIVCPITGGQREFLEEFQDRVAFVDPFDINSIKEGIKQGLDSNLDKLSYDEVMNKFSYDKVSKKIFDILKQEE